MTERNKMTNDQKYLRDAQLELGVTPAEMAALLYTSIHTYRAWLYGKRRLPGIGRVAIDLMLAAEAVETPPPVLANALEKLRQKC